MDDATPGQFTHTLYFHNTPLITHTRFKTQAFIYALWLNVKIAKDKRF